MWSRKPRPVATRARPPPSRPRRTSMRVSRVRAAHLADAVAAHAAVGLRRLAAGELARARASRRVVGGAVRDGHAEAVGQQRLVRERAHGAAALARGARRRRARASARARSCRRAPAPRRPRGACRRPASRAPRRSRRSAPAARAISWQASSADRGRPRRDRARRPQGVERLGQGGLREAVADACRAEREALRERARDDEVLVRWRRGPRDPRRRARGRPGRARRCPGRRRRCARRRAAASCSPVGLFGLQSQTRRTPAASALELLARQREARRRDRARPPRRPRCGWRPRTAGRSAWRRARDRPGRARAARTVPGSRHSPRRPRPGSRPRPRSRRSRA